MLSLATAACEDPNANPDGGLGHDMGLKVSPDPANLELNQGGPAVSQTFTAVAHLPGGDQDVTHDATWSMDDRGLGTLAGPTFTSGTTRGGTTLVHAHYRIPGSATDLSGEAILNVRFHAVSTGTCPGCPPFPPDSAPPCAGPNGAPGLIYPQDGVLLPPNMNVIEVHFMPGDGNKYYEIDFQNDATDVRVETLCDMTVVNTRGGDTHGCAYQLDPTVWNYVAQTNRGGNPVRVTVRGAPTDVSCASRSSSRNISYAQEDLNGGIYYWQSLAPGGMAGKTGGIFRHDFGNPSNMSEPFLVPSTFNLTQCVGCHFLSRDGTRMTYGSDDADSDDEYNDLHAVLYDVQNRTSIATGLPAGFQSFSPDNAWLLASDGLGTSNPPIFSRYNGNTGAAGTTLTLSTLTGHRATQPDWTKDNQAVYFVVPGQVLTWGSHKDDDHFGGGSIYKTSFDAIANQFGTPTPVIMSRGADENNYYPSVSPDGLFLVWNRADGTTLQTHDAFNNPNARLWALNLGGGQPVDMQKANLGDGLTNSWPRWSPFVQMYRNQRLLWVTFSSTRDYGLRVQNQNQMPALTNCYPPDSPEDPNGTHGQPFPANCNQPQIWMAAVSLSDLEQASGDPSFPAFWLPFQDMTAHNHIAQWVERVVSAPPTDGGACGGYGAACDTGNPCCEGYGCLNGTCQYIIP